MAQVRAHVTAKDGTRLYVEDTGPGKGKGHPILFPHEFAGDHRSWAGQVARFSKTHRCVVPAARGYPPSDAPDDAGAYGFATAAAGTWPSRKPQPAVRRTG